MQKSESICALSKALVQAISEMENASKNAVNPHFKSKYADLAEVIATTKPTLKKYGLAVAQFPSFENGLVGVETIILHDSGEWLCGLASSPIQKLDPQAVGSAITYLRRYSLAAVCGLTQEDDDGNAAVRPTKNAPTVDDYNALLSEAAKNKGKEFAPYKEIKDIPEVLKKWADEYMGK